MPTTAASRPNTLTVVGGCWSWSASSLARSAYAFAARWVGVGERAPRQAPEHPPEQHSAESLGVGQRLVEHRPFAFVLTLLGRDPAAQVESGRRGRSEPRRATAPPRRSGTRHRCRRTARTPRPSRSARRPAARARWLATVRMPPRGCGGPPSSCRHQVARPPARCSSSAADVRSPARRWCVAIRPAYSVSRSRAWSLIQSAASRCSRWRSRSSTVS